LTDPCQTWTQASHDHSLSKKPKTKIEKIEKKTSKKVEKIEKLFLPSGGGEKTEKMGY